MDPTVQNEAELLVEQQRQLCEDLQAELAEVVEQSRALEERCCSLEEQLLRSNEEAVLKQFRALEALRSKSEAREDRLVEQIQSLQRQMQEMQLQLQRLQSQGSAETGSSAVVATPGGNQQTTTESSVPISGNLTGGHSQDQQTIVTLVAKPAQPDSRSDLIKSADPQLTVLVPRPINPKKGQV